jgi:hypothetical protein
MPAVLALACVCVACIVFVWPASSASAASCPNPRDPDADYLCPSGPPYLIPALTDVGGWDEGAHFTNILYGDLVGDGRDEMVARGPGGVEVYRFRSETGQWSQVVVPPILRDRDGWDAPRYYDTLDLGDIDGNGRDELVIRGPEGIIVFRYEPGSSPNSASWRQLTTSGPFPASGWSSPQHYETIGLTAAGRAGEKRTMQLAARGRLGYGIWRWNGNGWTPIKGITALSDENGFDDRRYYSTIQAWDGELLLARGRAGMMVFRYLPNANDWRRESASGPCAVEGSGGFPCDSETIQLARGVPGAKGSPVLLARDSRGGFGLRLARYDTEQNRWTYPEQSKNPWHEAVYDKARYSDTLQAADLDGDGHDEVLGRAEGGMAVFDLAFRNDGSYGWGNGQSFARPDLTDLDEPRYFRTITTARLTPGSKARSLVARGPTGLRTWRWDKGRRQFERPRPYADFPHIERRALDGMSNFLGIGRGTVRDVYTEASRDPTLDRLAGLQNSLAATCTGLESASPPRYASCSPPGSLTGISNVSWRYAVNTIVEELYWARQVVGYFETLDDIQTKLFLDQNAQFPSIVADLKIATAPNDARVGLDWMELISTVAEIAIGADIPFVSKPLGAIGAAITLTAALTPRAMGDSPSDLEVGAAELQRTMVKLQQEMRDSITRQRRYVLGDRGLAATVGRLVASDVWELDRQAALSAGREAYTRSIYHGLLPSLWDRWEVERCVGGQVKQCLAPQAGPLLNWWYRPGQSIRSVNFRGLVPRQDPCPPNFILDFGNRNCTFKSLEEAGYGDTIQTLLTPVPASCRYDPVSGTSWRYGCPIGARAENLLSPPEGSPWRRFRLRRCDYLLYNQPSKSCHVAQE